MHTSSRKEKEVTIRSHPLSPCGPVNEAPSRATSPEMSTSLRILREDRGQDPDLWCSRTPNGQEFWQVISQWVWNVRLELGQHLSPTAMRTTEFAPAFEALPALTSEYAPGPASTLAFASQTHASTRVDLSFSGCSWPQRPFSPSLRPGDPLPQQVIVPPEWRDRSPPLWQDAA
jgi:hypothetical protein